MSYAKTMDNFRGNLLNHCIRESKESSPFPRYSQEKKTSNSGDPAPPGNVCTVFNNFADNGMAMTLPRDFKDFLKLLNKHRVRYLLIGGYAVSLYGYVRATNDMDFWVSDDPVNKKRLKTVLEKFGFSRHSLPQDLFYLPGQILRMGIPPMRIEIVSTISGVAFKECFKARKRITVDDISINVISLPHLLKNKKASGRPQDLADYEKLNAES